MRSDALESRWLVLVGPSPVAANMATTANFIVSAELEGYGPVEQTVWAKPDQPRTLILRLDRTLADAGPVTLANPTLNVVVESFPSGAFVFIDRGDAGVTPLTASVPAGPHEIIVFYGGYLRATEFIDGGPGETRRVFAKLVPGG